MDSYTKLAQEAIEKFIKEDAIIEIPDNLPTEFYNRRAGVFVTIYNNKELRGCIGTYLPTRKNIVEEIIYNAISAGTEDFRFEPITAEELPELRYEVSLLSEPEEVKDKNTLDAKKFGVIIKTDDGRCGLLLPDLEGVNKPEEQIAIACQKGGIDSRFDKYKLFKFTVEKHK